MAGNTATYVMAEGAIVVDMDEESIALNVDAGRYFGVRGAMRHLIPDLRAGTTREAMVARLCELYDVTAEAAARDIDRMLPQLIEAQLVRQVAAA